MTDPAKELEELALTAFGSSADALLLRAAAELRRLQADNARLQKLVDDCAPFLEDGETPEEGLCRYDTNYANLWHSIEAKN